ncbi:MAG: hypothetical protein IKP61_02045 [Spirochaetales bacterium]|nr:hypothetical protein [Spirochaetales bacterium]
MKEYDFPYYGSGGKGDSWDNKVSVVLSDEEDRRLRQSAESEKWYRLSEDPDLNDIYLRVLEAAYKQEIQNLSVLKEMYNEYREDFSEDDDPEDLPIEVILRRYLDEQCIGINYPEELCPLFEE